VKGKNLGGEEGNMATGKLIGHDDVALNAGNASNYIVIDKFTASATGNVTEIRFRTKASLAANVRVGMYADSGGTAGALLGQKEVAVSSGAEREITVTLDSPIPVMSGTAYWLACNNSANDIVGIKTETAVAHMWKISAYGPLPDPAGTGYTTDNTNCTIISGWGTIVLTPSGISQPLSYGSPKLAFTNNPSGISQALAYGTPLVELAGAFIYPTGIEQTIVLGTPELIKLLQIIYPTGIDQPLVTGTPVLIYPQTLASQGIAQAIAFGTPSVAIYGIIRPDGIAQVVAIGSPTLLKYVWHVILDGQYLTETPAKNRQFVIGRDDYGNPVSGEAQDSTEIGLVGERLDFQQELAIPTESQASSMASAILSKMRLTGKRGVIFIPPNCGQELFDVVQISDSGANQSAVSFRVVGIRFEYNPKQARYHHKLILGSP
jgi:hypothetical protein